MKYLILLLIPMMGIISFMCSSDIKEYKNINSTPIEQRNAYLFEPDILIEKDAWTFTPTVSLDGNTMMFVRWVKPDLMKGNASIQHLYQSKKNEKGEWSEPQIVKKLSDSRVDYPQFSPDGKYFYISFNRYHEKQYNYPNETFWDDFDIWRANVINKNEIDWSTFQPMEGNEINLYKTPRKAVLAMSTTRLHQGLPIAVIYTSGHKERKAI